MRKLASIPAVVITMVMLGASAAYATPGPLDGVATEANAARDEFASFVTATAVPILFGLLILGVGIALAVKYVRRGARSA